MMTLASFGRTGEENSSVGWLILAVGFLLTLIALVHCHRMDVPGKGRVSLISVIFGVIMIAYLVYCLSRF